jgi:hypothetical protein
MEKSAHVKVETPPQIFPIGSVEKTRQRRSRPWAVLTYLSYAPPVPEAAAFPSKDSGQDSIGQAF